MDIHRTHNICHGYNHNIIISMITLGHIPIVLNIVDTKMATLVPLAK